MPVRPLVSVRRAGPLGVVGPTRPGAAFVRPQPNGERPSPRSPLSRGTAGASSRLSPSVPFPLCSPQLRFGSARLGSSRASESSGDPQPPMGGQPTLGSKGCWDLAWGPRGLTRLPVLLGFLAQSGSQQERTRFPAPHLGTRKDIPDKTPRIAKYVTCSQSVT